MLFAISEKQVRDAMPVVSNDLFQNLPTQRAPTRLTLDQHQRPIVRTIDEDVAALLHPFYLFFYLYKRRRIVAVRDEVVDTMLADPLLSSERDILFAYPIEDVRLLSLPPKAAIKSWQIELFHRCILKIPASKLF